MPFKTLLLAFGLMGALPGAEFDILSEGLTQKPTSLNYTVVAKSQKDLETIWSELGISVNAPTIDFTRELVVAIAPTAKLGSAVKIIGIDKSDNNIEIKYFVAPPTAEIKKRKENIFPYSVAKIYTPFPQKAQVKFTEELLNVPANVSLGYTPSYTSVLKSYSSKEFTNYFPLDKGNSWTYRIEKKNEKGELTFSIVSISRDGWSKFDRFFGLEHVSLQTPPNSELMVMTNNIMKPFYTQNVQKSFSKSTFSTPAGKFIDLMYITVPKSDKFWFKDVYARGVGLVYHEHKNHKVTVKYTLIKANIRGAKLP